MVTNNAQCGARWHQYLIAIAVLAFPCISGCAMTPAAAPQAASSAPALPALPAPALTLDEVVALARGGQQADAIIARIRNAGALYRLSAAEVVSLARKGLPLPVIDHILLSERQFSAGQIQAPGAQNQPVPVKTAPQRPIPALYLGV